VVGDGRTWCARRWTRVTRDLAGESHAAARDNGRTQFVSPSVSLGLIVGSKDDDPRARAVRGTSQDANQERDGSEPHELTKANDDPPDRDQEKSSKEASEETVVNHGPYPKWEPRDKPTHERGNEHRRGPSAPTEIDPEERRNTQSNPTHGHARRPTRLKEKEDRRHRRRPKKHRSRDVTPGPLANLKNDATHAFNLLNARVFPTTLTGTMLL